jgi:hypothetical protein
MDSAYHSYRLYCCRELALNAASKMTFTILSKEEHQICEGSCDVYIHIGAIHGYFGYTFFVYRTVFIFVFVFMFESCCCVVKGVSIVIQILSWGHISICLQNFLV